MSANDGQARWTAAGQDAGVEPGAEAKPGHLTVGPAVARALIGPGCLRGCLRAMIMSVARDRIWPEETASGQPFCAWPVVFTAARPGAGALRASRPIGRSGVPKIRTSGRVKPACSNTAATWSSRS